MDTTIAPMPAAAFVTKAGCRKWRMLWKISKTAEPAIKAACPIDARGSTLPCPKRWPESAGTSDWRTAHQFSRDAATSRLESIRLDSKATESVTIRANSFTPIKTTATATDAAAADFIKNAEDFSSDTAKASL